MGTKIGVVFDLPFREVKRVVVPDYVWQLPMHVSKGEAMLVLDHDGPVNLGSLPKIVARAERMLNP